MKIFVLAALAATVLGGSAVHAAEGASKSDALAIVGKAVTHFKQVGPEKAFADFSNPQGGFTDRDLYIVAYDLNGRCVAHGANTKLIGKDLIDAEDVDGKLYIKERMDLAKAKGKFWQDYKFTNPLTKAVEPKETYCEVSDKYVLCGGIYKK